MVVRVSKIYINDYPRGSRKVIVCGHSDDTV